MYKEIARFLINMYQRTIWIFINKYQEIFGFLISFTIILIILQNSYNKFLQKHRRIKDQNQKLRHQQESLNDKIKNLKKKIQKKKENMRNNRKSSIKKILEIVGK